MSVSRDQRTERRFNLHDQVIVRSARQIAGGVSGLVWGYEWSDGGNAMGRPLVKYHGWFYHVREGGSEDSLIVPESKLMRA